MRFCTAVRRKLPLGVRYLLKEQIFKSSLLDHSIMFSSKVIDFRKNAFNFNFKDFFFFFLMRKKLIHKAF